MDLVGLAVDRLHSCSIVWGQPCEESRLLGGLARLLVCCPMRMLHTRRADVASPSSRRDLILTGAMYLSSTSHQRTFQQSAFVLCL